MTNNSEVPSSDNQEKKGVARRHPILTNVVIIILIAVFGVCIAYLSLSLFTKHGQKHQVPEVVGIGYTDAINKLHDAGFKIDIRDSLYLEGVKPGMVVEQYPRAGSMVKPGRRIFLYINAVYPKQVVIDATSSNPVGYALAGYGMRQATAMLEEAGFKNIKIVYLHGDTDRVVRVLANGKAVRVLEKVPVTATITLEVYDNSMQAINDSIQNDAFLEQVVEEYEEGNLENIYVEGEEEEVNDNTPAPVETEPEYIEY